jgi:CRISPR-associated protein Csb2
MSEQVLILEVRLLHDRWHGEGDWPPAPFRLYQALIAAALSGRWRESGKADTTIRGAFRWLESLAPPIVCAPPAREAMPVQYFVPNNDLDAKGSDPRRAAEIRSAKLVKSRIIDGGAPLLYAWRFDDGERHARRIVDLSERLHTFGRGIDPAYARGSIETKQELDSRIFTYTGSVAKPDVILEGSQDGSLLRCPAVGSLDRLDERFVATTHRLQRALARCSLRSKSASTRL